MNSKKVFEAVILGLMALAMIRCGGDDAGSIRIVTGGQTYEMALQNSQCQAGIPNGSGLYNLPIFCSAGFSNTGGIADSLVVNVTDVRAVADQLGTFIPISPSLLLMTVTLDGNQLAITDGGAIFSEVSNLSGGKNCFQFQINSAQAHMEGNFCGNNTVGF